MIYGEILAGGNGTRMENPELPKQYMIIGNKPIIIHTLEQFVLNPNINKIIICCPKDWIDYTLDIIDKYNLSSANIDVIEGGKTRSESLINGCEYIKNKYGLSSDDFILTHDAVRPFINQRIIEDNIKMVKKYGAINTVFPAIDTIVESKDKDFISNIPIRSIMYQGQSPQSFNILELMELYKTLTEEEKSTLTDACKIFILKGKKVKLVDGEPYNFKITTAYDYIFANAIFESKLSKNIVEKQ